MKEEKMDRRVKYTLKALKEAMVQLLLEQHISKISVVSLCKLADVNRSTFYTHFQDPYDLLHSITEEVLSDTKVYLRNLNREDDRISLQALEDILEYVKENTHVFRALLSDNGEPDIQRKIMQMTEIVSAADYKNLDERTKEYYILFQISGCISILHKWLEEGTPESAKEMSFLILKVLGKVA